MKYKIATLIMLAISDLCLHADLIAVSYLPDQGFAQTLMLTDVNGNGTTVAIDFYDQLGKQVKATKKIIQPYSSIKVDISDYLKVPGSITVNFKSDPVIGERYHMRSATPLFSIPMMRPQAQTEYLLLYLPSHQTDQRSIVITDVGGSGSEAEVTLYDQKGNFLVLIKKSILPHGTATMKVDETLAGDLGGKALVKFSKGSAICEYKQVDKSKQRGFAIASIPLSSQSLKSHLLINRFASESKNRTKLIITDADGKAAAVKISLYDRKGKAISQFKKLLQANATIIIDQSDYTSDLNQVDTTYLESEDSILAALYLPETQTLIPSFKVFGHMGKKQSIVWINPKRGSQAYLALSQYGSNVVEVKAKLYSENGTFAKEMKFLTKPNELLVQPLEFETEYAMTSVVLDSLSGNLIASCLIVDPDLDQLLLAPQAQSF